MKIKRLEMKQQLHLNISSLAKPNKINIFHERGELMPTPRSTKIFCNPYHSCGPFYHIHCVLPPMGKTSVNSSPRSVLGLKRFPPTFSLSLGNLFDWKIFNKARGFHGLQENCTSFYTLLTVPFTFS